jgi:hypothetical protein
MRTLTAFHSLKTAIKHISKDIDEPQKGRNSCPQLPLFELSLKGATMSLFMCFIAVFKL